MAFGTNRKDDTNKKFGMNKSDQSSDDNLTDGTDPNESAEDKNSLESLKRSI